jgi:hypothetical protein
MDYVKNISEVYVRIRGRWHNLLYFITMYSYVLKFGGLLFGTHSNVETKQDFGGLISNI